MNKLKVLICDDMEHVRLNHEHTLFQCGGGVFMPVVTLAEQALEATKVAEDAAAGGQPYDLILMDVDFGEVVSENRMNGFEAATLIHKVSPATVIVMISAYSTEDNLELARKSPFVEKFLRRGSFAKSELRDICRFALVRRHHAGNTLLPVKSVLHTQSPVMMDFLKQVDRVGPDRNVVFYGESGTGKQLAAQRINANAKVMLGEAKRDFVSLNCGGLTPTLLLSELFGHERGAFTGANQEKKGWLEKADGGDILLDELQNAPMEFQEALLLVLQNKEYSRVGGTAVKKLNVRFIAALNENPSDAKRAGRLRTDLLARLQEEYFVIPALRDRKGDIPALVKHFQTMAGEADKTFSKEAIEFLESLSWPTNVRGLMSTVHSAIKSSRLPVITVDTLKDLEIIKEMLQEYQATIGLSAHSEETKTWEQKAESVIEACINSGVPLDIAVKGFEKLMLSYLLKQERVLARLARRLHISETSLRRRLQEHNLF